MRSWTTMVTIMMLTVEVALMAWGASAVQHKVGGTVGWNFPPSQGAAFFATWASQNKFQVGDSLAFEYIAGTHNVVQVERSDYDACRSSRPVQLYSANIVPTFVNLRNPGTYYYICGIKGHCEAGMKVALTVS